MKIRPFRAIIPNLNIITSYDSFFNTVRDKFSEFRKSGFFIAEEKPAVYIYKIYSETGNYAGIVVANDIEDLYRGNILQHERTLAKKEQMMTELMLERQALIKAVLLAYRGVKSIDDFIELETKEKPFLEVVFDEKDESHRLWKITDPFKIEQLKKLFEEKVSHAYIADGHHRCSTIRLLRENQIKQKEANPIDGLLTIYLPFSQLKIFDYNRVVDLSDFGSSLAFMAEMSRYFNIRRISSPRKAKKKHEIIMLLDDEYFRLRWKKPFIEANRDNRVLLDVLLFNRYVLGQILGVIDIKKSNIVHYVPGPGGIDSIIRTIRDANHGAGFCFYPVTADELMDIAENNVTLPPKSTWFEPRILNGIIGIPFAESGM